MEDITITRKCRDCHKPFSIGQDEANWLKERNLEMFTRCSECRRKNKERKEKVADKEEILEALKGFINWAYDRTNTVLEAQKLSIPAEQHNAINDHICDLSTISMELIRIRSILKGL